MLTRFITPILIIGVALTLLGCTALRVQRYSDMIEPNIGSATKAEMNQMLGSPAFCHQEAAFEECEYRTATARNVPIPSIFTKMPDGFGPDLSPYAYFDVLHLYYDGFSVLKDWAPIVVVQ